MFKINTYFLFNIIVFSKILVIIIVCVLSFLFSFFTFIFISVFILYNFFT